MNARCLLLIVALYELGIARGHAIARRPSIPGRDVAADARNAALGGLDVAPLQADGGSIAVHPAAIDSSVEGHLYTSYLDHLGGLKAGAIAMPLQTRGHRSSHVGVRFASYGTFDGFTAAGESTGEFSGGDYIAQYGSAWVIDTVWVIGATGYAGLHCAAVNAGVPGSIWDWFDEAETATGRWAF